jgi:hypothetical protein
MSLFTAIEKTIERAFSSWTGRVFGPADSGELIVVHRAILADVETQIQTVQRGKRLFPYNRMTVRLASEDAARRALYLAAFGQGRLEKDIRDAFSAVDCDAPAGFVVEVEAVETGTRPFAIEYAMQAAAPVSAPQPSVAPARLELLRGQAHPAPFEIARPRINIGRLAELTDADGRILRRNDLVFDDAPEEANSSVSRQHAHIRLDAESGDYRLCDDGSEFGTRIFRDGRSIEVPPGNRRGERLRPGDEIYLGRACLRFDR